MIKLNVSKSIVINAPLEKVKSVVTDFHQWPVWSPWLITEPEAEVKVDEDGKHYSWSGKRVGAGEMTVVRESDGVIDYDLTFLKPWKSKSKVFFYLKQEGENTNVKWTMDSSLPLFLFWMKKKTEGFIGMDYDKGLMMLKEYVEDGTVTSRLEFVGEHEYEGCNFIGIKTKTPFSKIGNAMKNDFTKLAAFAEENNLSINGTPFSQYHKFDIVKGDVVYTAGFPVAERPNNLSNGIISGSLPKMKVHTVRHHGFYEYLGNAWSASMMMQRGKEFKANKKIHPIEFYLNDPDEVKPAELITDVSFAVK